VRMREIYGALTQDGYERDDRSRTIAVLYRDQPSGAREIAGVVRIVFGRHHDQSAQLLPLDIMNFVRPIGAWPHQQTGIGENSIGELGRFTIAERFREPAMREANVDAQICRSLFTVALRIAHQRGVRLIYALMPAHASDVCRRADVDLQDIPIRLLEEDPAAVKVFEEFSVYWRRLTPRLYILRESAATRRALFRNVLPADAVLTDAAELDRYGQNVSALQGAISLVLRPSTEDEVARILEIANQHNIPLYPCSTGKNWGLGSELPVADGCVVVDLSRMNRIVKIDPELRYAILQPGVTQLQLARALAEQYPELTVNFTGSFAYTGIVGNVLERGDGGHARIDDLLGVRGFLGDGRPFAVGGMWEDASAGGHTMRYAAGPDLAGIFSQSNFGVVTQLAFRLMRKPESRYILWGTAANDRLESLVETIQDFIAQGALNPGGVNIGYANRFVQARSTLAGEAAQVNDDWDFYVLTGGPARVASVLAEEIGARLAPLCKAAGTFRVGRGAGAHDDPRTLLAFLQPIVSPLLGMPDASSIKLIYQLTGTTVPEDDSTIDADHTPFGMKCYIPIVPPTPAHVRRAAELVAQIRQASDANIKTSFFGDGRTLITIHFRRDLPEAVATAERCERDLWDRFTAAGYWPYRASIDQMDRLIALRPAFFDLVSRLKRELDPRGIIGPNASCPTAAAAATATV
jgi:4-cresol dehydrogenase (hydroxylating)